jgi:N-methylhydantoinase B
MPERSSSLDPITFAVVRNSLLSAAREMFSVFKRTTMLPVLYESNDFGMSIYDSRLNLIAEAPGLPLFVGSLDHCIEATLKEIGEEGALREGDILVNNHPYLTAGHPADMVLIEPVFHGSRVVAFSALRAHMGDLGAKGLYPTDSTDVFQEGTIFPALKLYEAGQLNDVIIKIVRANSRLPVETVGNILAGVGALRAGSRVIRDVVSKYGVETYFSVVDELLDHGERVARLGLAQIKDGRYEFEDMIDDDGVRLGAAVKIRCTVTISDSDLTIDLTGSDPEQLGPINCPWGYSLTACRYVLKRLVTPDIPPNGGEHRVLNLIAPEGTLFNPTPPAACHLGWLGAMRLTELIVDALAPALPDRIPAENSGDILEIVGLLKDPTTGRLSMFEDGAPLGHGAIRGKDGMSALHHPIQAGVQNYPAELLETRMPVLRRRQELIQDSGGAGTFRGGLAATGEYELLGDGLLIVIVDKARASHVRGLFGGMSPPDRNEVVLFPGTDREMRLGKQSDIPVRSGDRLISRPAGGGGYGPPSARDPERVRWDVLNGYVSREAADRLYGVVLSDDGEIDSNATDVARQAMSSAGSQPAHER